MTIEEFDNTKFGRNDEIVVRKYLHREKERVVWVNFGERLINGYKPMEIVEYITNRRK